MRTYWLLDGLAASSSKMYPVAKEEARTGEGVKGERGRRRTPLPAGHVCIHSVRRGWGWCAFHPCTSTHTYILYLLPVDRLGVSCLCGDGTLHSLQVYTLLFYTTSGREGMCAQAMSYHTYRTSVAGALSRPQAPDPWSGLTATAHLDCSFPSHICALFAPHCYLSLGDS
jgi:hypothetical protein